MPVCIMLRELLLCLALLLSPAVAVAETAGDQSPPVPVAGEPFAPPLRMVMDVRSNHSDGRHSIEELAGLAAERGIDVLAINEHDRFSIRLGIDPIPQILGYSQQHPSLYETGVEAFFADLARTRHRHPEMLFLAGTESTPGYYWSGIPFRDLTLHDAERHIITLGVETPQQIESLPSFDLRYGFGSRELSLIVWCGVALLVLVVLIRKRKGLAALLLLVSFIAFLAGWLMQKPVDADAGFLKSARAQGLFTAWAHPGTLSGVRPGPLGVRLDTLPYSARVFEPPTADAFAAVYGDTDTNTEPGDRWDRYMIDYLGGWLKKPIWAVAAGDFHAQGEANEYLGNYPMDVWAEEKNAAAVLAALRNGRSVAWGMPRQRNIRAAELYLQPAGGAPILPGGKPVAVPAQAELVVRLSEAGEVRQPVVLKGEWIVDGVVDGVVDLPVNGMAVRLSIDLAAGPHVVRLRIPMQRGIRMEANPFLLRVAS